MQINRYVIQDLYPNFSLLKKIKSRPDSIRSGPGSHHCRSFTDTLRHTTLGRTPLSEWSVWSVPLYNIFPYYLIKDAIFEKKSYWAQNVCFDIFYNFCLKHFSFKEEMSDIWSKMFIGLHLKYLLFLSNFNENWIFSTFFSKNTKISNFVKIRPVGAELFHAHGRTDGRTRRN